MCCESPLQHRVCRACTPSQFHPPSAEPHTMSLSCIIVAFVTKHLLHVHQQVLQRDILAFIQGAGPFTGVPTETGKDMRVNTGLIILLKEGINIKPPECICYFCSWISRLEDRHIQSCRSQPLLFPTPSVTPALMLMACGLTCSGVPIRVWCSPIW